MRAASEVGADAALLGLRLDAGREHHAGRDGIDANAARPELGRKVAGVVGDRGLGDAVVGEATARHDHPGRRRRGVHDHAGLLRRHHWDDGPAAVDRAHQVGVEGEADVLVGHDGRLAALDGRDRAASVVDQDVDWAEHVAHAGDRIVDRATVGQVGLDADALAAERLDLRGDRGRAELLAELRRA